MSFKPTPVEPCRMDEDDLVADVRANRETPLSRLGSDKYLIAATGADLATPAVLREAARTAASGRDVFERWADEERGDAATAFAAAARREADHYERVVADLDERPGPDGAVHAAVADRTGAVERVGAGLVGRGLVRERTTLQVVNFFINEGDNSRADLFREVRSGAEDDVETGADLLAAASSQERERARTAAEAVIERAYEAYADALDAMGVDPKPVC